MFTVRNGIADTVTRFDTFRGRNLKPTLPRLVDAHQRRLAPQPEANAQPAAGLLSSVLACQNRAPACGRAKCKGHPSAMNAVAREFDSLTQAHAAILGGKLSLIQQPVVLAKNPAVTFYHECLARLRVGDRYLSAERFIPEMDRVGALNLFDRQVIELVAHQLQLQPSRCFGANIVLSNLSDPDQWLELLRVLQSLASANLSRRIILELTETNPWSDPAAIIERISALRMMGFRIALDDFGVAYATPQILSQAAFDIVKVDKLFLKTIRAATEASTSLQSLIHFAACYCPIVVVEGVETVSEAMVARDAGATHLQGYLFKAAIQ